MLETASPLPVWDLLRQGQALPVYCVVLVIMLIGAAASLLFNKSEHAGKASSFSLVTASIIGLPVSLHALCTGASAHMALDFVHLPFGAFTLGLDPLASFFLIPVFLLCLIGALLLPERMRRLQESTGHALHFGRHGCAYCLLAAGMVLVLLAADSVLFMVSWEIMSLAPFFLINPADNYPTYREEPAPGLRVRNWSPAWMYLIAAHIGAMPLLYLFAGMSAEAGGTGFTTLLAHENWQQAGLFFVLAVVGFGVKIGLVPLHGWMPRVYAQAPAHVVIVLAGAMFNLGIYGILRVCSLVEVLPEWSGYVLMALGAFSGIAAILLALMQKEIRRVLAYSSAENAGIICLGIGAAMVQGNELWGVGRISSLLLLGVLLHIWNHSLYKSLLLLSSCAIEEGTGTGLIRLLGGLHKRVPITGFCFAIGAAAIAGLPPLNGFLSELLLYCGFAEAAQSTADLTGVYAVSFSAGGILGPQPIVFWAAIFILATISGLSVFAFTRVFGLAFLGNPRDVQATMAREPEGLYRRAMVLLAILCISIPLLASIAAKALIPVLTLLPGASFSHTSLHELEANINAATNWILPGYGLAASLFLLLAALLFGLRRRIVRRNGEQAGPTWDCGYAYPSARMQYTDGSFAHTVGTLLQPLTRTQFTVPRIADLFPDSAHADMRTPDWSLRLWKYGLFLPVAALAKKIKRLQAGLVNMYVLYIFVALVAGLVWALR